MLAFLLFLAGCASGPEVPDFRGSGAPRARPLVVNVENQHFADIVVYVSTGGLWQRLGDVPGASRGSLTVPQSAHAPAGRYRLRVHPVGGQDRDDYVSDFIHASGGDVIELQVAGALRMSSWWIR